MATFGDLNPPSGGQGFYYDIDGNAQFWDKYTNFPGGTITDLWVYMGGYGGSTTGEVCLWVGNTLQYSSGSISIPAGSNAINGQGWLHISGLNIYVAAGNDLGLGVWAVGSVIWTYDQSGGTVYYESGLSGGPTGAGSPTGTRPGGPLFAYVTYTPSQLYVNTGTPSAPVWTAAQVFVNTGTPQNPIWTPANEVLVNTGTSSNPVWTPAG